jgi:nudix-type nucleoside diphosphatase (YffH/AdpP family)
LNKGAFKPMQVKIIENKRLLDDFFQVDAVTLKHERFDGCMSVPVRRLNLERGQAVAVLIYIRDRDSFIFVRQFRYAVYAAGESGWLDEIVAGVMEGDDPLDCAKRECIEETGYVIDEFVKIGFIYPTPGITTERIHLYIGYCNSDSRQYSGGGLDAENEDILVLEIPRTKAIQKLKNGEFTDGKTITALQHFLLNEK